MQHMQRNKYHVQTRKNCFEETILSHKIENKKHLLDSRLSDTRGYRDSHESFPREISMRIPRQIFPPPRRDKSRGGYKFLAYKT